jgi:cytochrome c553
MKTTPLALALGALMIAGGPQAAPPDAKIVAASPANVAAREYDEVMALTPDPARGAKVYITCAVCHRPDGWGSPDGDYPQIAGQLSTVIIKQLADIRARNRDNPLMYPFSVPRILGGAQEMADVAAYVSRLPMTADNGKGPGTDLELGKRLYHEHCTKCHGESGEGNPRDHIPAVAGQHYLYQVRQFDAIRSGARKNADPKMTQQIHGFTPQEESAVLDYTSRLTPAADKLAKPGWTNPDFPTYVPPPMPATPRMPQPPAMPPIPQPPAMPTMPTPPAMPAMPPSMPPMPGTVPGRS